MKLEALPLTGTLGAEIRGPDVAKGVSEEAAAAILDALYAHRVIFLRNQDVTDDQHVAFSRQLGPLFTDYAPYLKTVEGHPEVTVLSGLKEDGAAFWHSDASGSKAPPMASILSMKEAPVYGGDTLFVDTTAAYDALSDRMKAYLEGLRGAHDPNTADRTMRKFSPTGDPPEFDRSAGASVSHPIVRTHPVTGRKILFVNRGYTTHIQGVPSVEGDAVLAFLFEHLLQPEFQCRWRWQKDDIAIWDNRAVQHYAIGDYGDAARTIHRTTLQGEAPF
jgi:taurine dioxygenase